MDRDALAQKLQLRSSQVITWFQNRRAKLKREDNEKKVSEKGDAKSEEQDTSLPTLVRTAESDHELQSLSSMEEEDNSEP